MFFSNTIENVKGYVNISIEGYFAERFINLCLNKSILLWDIQRQNDGFLLAKVNVKDYKNLKNIARITRCRIKIINKKGFPFIAHRYRKRKIFIALFFIVAISIYVYNLFIWDVQIMGDFTIPIEELKEQLEEENVKIGSMKKNIDPVAIKLNMNLVRNDLAWIGINIKGTKVFVEIVPKVMKPDDILSNEPCNIISDKEGIITKINAREGVKTVAEGDLVTKGQLLISGIVSSQYAEDRYVHADGEIYIKTWYIDKVKIPFERDLISKTTEFEYKYVIKILNYEINFLNSSTKFEKYDKITITNKLNLFGLLEFPIEVTKNIYNKIDVDTVRYTEIQAERIAINEAMIRALKQIPKESEIANNKVYIIKYEDGIEAEVTVECIEKAGLKQKIGG